MFNYSAVFKAMLVLISEVLGLKSEGCRTCSINSVSIRRSNASASTKAYLVSKEVRKMTEAKGIQIPKDRS